MTSDFISSIIASHMITPERLGDLYTANSFKNLSVEPVPSAAESIDFAAEAENISVWRNGRGFEYHLEPENLTRIASWEDKEGVLRLAVAEMVDGNWPVWREPTLAETVKFLRVASYAMPGTPYTSVLRAQVEARIISQQEASQERISKLQSLSDFLSS